MTARSRRGMTASGILALCSGFYIRGGLYDAGQDAWVAALLCTALLVPVTLWLGVLARRAPGESFFGILRAALPPWAAKAAAAAAVLATLVSAVTTVQTFTVFLQSNILADTPQCVTAAFLLTAALLPVRAGRRVLGDWSALLFAGAAALAGPLLAFSVSRFDPANLRPVLASPGGLLSGTLRMLPAWLWMLLPLTALFPGGEGRFPLLPCLLAAGGFTAVVFAANTLVLSPAVTGSIRYITYYAASVIGVGEFFQHVEILSAFVCQCATLVSLSVQLLFLCHGLEALLSLPDGRRLAAPAALLVYGLHANLSYSAVEALSGGLRRAALLPPLLLLAAASLPGRRIRPSRRFKRSK